MRGAVYFQGSFTATPQGNAIVLTWETALEIDVLGFHLYRADAPDAEPARLTTALIPATGGPVYTYLDARATPGQTFYYWLEIVDIGGESTRYGPVTAIGSYLIHLPLVVRP